MGLEQHPLQYIACYGSHAAPYLSACLLNEEEGYAADYLQTMLKVGETLELAIELRKTNEGKAIRTGQTEG